MILIRLTYLNFFLIHLISFVLRPDVLKTTGSLSLTSKRNPITGLKHVNRDPWPGKQANHQAAGRLFLAFVSWLNFANQMQESEKRMAARLLGFVRLLWAVGGALEKQQIDRSKEQRRWEKESGGKKLTALIWNQKQSAAWQSLKSCTCTFRKPALRCASLAPTLSFCFPLFSFHELRLAALSFSACSLCAVHHVPCVSCGHPWGRRERWGESVLEPQCQVG